jgi:hypothetical protein
MRLFSDVLNVILIYVGYMVPLAEDDETIDENIVIPLRVLLSVNPTDI